GPNAVAPDPDAVAPSPKAVEAIPEALVFQPPAKEYTPMLLWFHSVDDTLPARKAALFGYHIIRVPPPLTGGAPGVTCGFSGPVNNTLLSLTVSIASGRVVLIPT